MMVRKCWRSARSRSGLSCRISENDRIEVSGVRSSWVTVDRKSSFSRSSSVSRAFAALSSVEAFSSAVDFCSSCRLYSRTCEVSSRICMISSTPTPSPLMVEATMTRADAAPMAPASLRSTNWTSSPSASGTERSWIPRRRAYSENSSSVRSRPRNCSARARSSRTDTVPCSRPAATARDAACSNTWTKSVAWIRSMVLCRSNSETATKAPTLTSRLQNRACAMGSNRAKPNRLWGWSSAMPSGPSSTKLVGSHPERANDGSSRV